MDRGVQVGRAGGDARLQHRHVDEGRADVDDDAALRRADQPLGGLHVHRVQRVRLQAADALQRALALDRFDDRVALSQGARGDVDVAQQRVVLRALVRYDLGDATGADDQDIALHSIPPVRSG